MNFIFGMFAIIATSYWSMHATGLPWKSFYNLEGIIIVMLGTFSIFLMSNRLNIFIKMIPTAFYSVKNGINKQLPPEILKVSEAWDRGQKPQTSEIKLLDKGVQWLSAGLDKDKILFLSDEYIRSEVEDIYTTAASIKNLSKYPPALGMMGTVLGLLGVFSNLNDANSAANVGMGLAIALTSTLYGLIVTNFFISPVSELIVQYAEIKTKENNLIKDSLQLMSTKSGTFMIKERMEAEREAA